MIDRRVQQISPKLDEGENPPARTFADYVDVANIVLLGDPGSGKSHLLKNTADGVSKLYVTARNFLNIPTFPPEAQLLIDALDERRAGRGDQTTIDHMVQKLFVLRPPRVCIACRVQDWLGETDLAAFQGYFGSSGGAVVLVLKPLSFDEQVAVLAEKGQANAEAFLAEASERGLEDFLINPQNLRMLSDVVQDGTWPETRKELFEQSTRVLLTEHNREKAYALEGSYTPEELVDAAGAACAIRLISDTDGISLANTDLETDCPSYRKFNFDPPEKMRAALTRRAFVANPSDNRVDYVHRTLAEYLAAVWMAKLVREGLPIGRICALIGIDGRPASELRGLNAWLSVVLPECAEQLICGDAYGALTYGDAKSLTPSSRRTLLKALADLSVKDPWFRAGNWSVGGIGGLSCAETVDDFRAVLRSSSASSSLRSIVLDALLQGTPQSALVPDLLTLVADKQVNDHDRIEAAEAVARCGPEARAVLANLYIQNLASNVSAIRVRAGIISTLYGDHFGAVDVAQLLVDTFKCEDDLPGGSLWLLHKKVPTEDIPTLLTHYAQLAPKGEAASEVENIWEITSTLDRLLIRVLADRNLTIDAADLWDWLNARADADTRSVRGYADEEKAALVSRPELLEALGDYSVRSYKAGETWWRFLRRLDQVTFGTYNRPSLVRCIIRQLNDATIDLSKAEELYQLAFAVVCGLEESHGPGEFFERLHSIADEKPFLVATREIALSCPLESWRNENRARTTKWNEKRDARRMQNRLAVEKSLASIRSGEDRGLLGWCAKLYFERADKAEIDPLEREIGKDNAAIVKEGFTNLLRGSVDQTPQSILETAVQNRYWKWWYALIAGMDSDWESHHSLDGLGDGLLGSLLTIDLLHPTPNRVGNFESDRERGWKRWLFEKRPTFVHDVYVLVARAWLTAKAVRVDGLYELLHHDAFVPFRARTAFSLLRDFPLVPTQYLEDMLRLTLSDPSLRAAFVDAANANLSNPSILEDSDRYDLWLSAAYLANPVQAASVGQIVEQVRDHLAVAQSNGGRSCKN